MPRRRLLHSPPRMATITARAVGSATRTPTHFGVAAGRRRTRICTSAVAVDGPGGEGRDAFLGARFGRRACLALLASTPLVRAPNNATASDDVDLAGLRREATEAYESADFQRAYRALTALCLEDTPGNRDKWLEGRAQVGVDLKLFEASIQDYAELLTRVDPIVHPERDAGPAARFHAGKALAYEGKYCISQIQAHCFISQLVTVCPYIAQTRLTLSFIFSGLYAWPLALSEYTQTVELADAGNFLPDPYVLNSLGNVFGSLGDWQSARSNYLESFALFQRSKGFKVGASTTSRLDGAVYASANAALSLVQLGDERLAEREMRGVARRAPNSADMRAALAALLYSNGNVAEAEEQWEQACARSVGCGRYKDLDYVRRIRRWPPKMVDKLDAFLKIK